MLTEVHGMQSGSTFDNYTTITRQQSQLQPKGIGNGLFSKRNSDVNFKFGMSPGSMMKRTGDALKGLHTINSHGSGMKNSSHTSGVVGDYNELPDIIPRRKLAGLEDSENPFKVVKSSE